MVHGECSGWAGRQTVIYNITHRLTQPIPWKGRRERGGRRGDEVEQGKEEG